MLEHQLPGTSDLYNLKFNAITNLWKKSEKTTSLTRGIY